MTRHDEYLSQLSAIDSALMCTDLSPLTNGIWEIGYTIIQNQNCLPVKRQNDNTCTSSPGNSNG